MERQRVVMIDDDEVYSDTYVRFLELDGFEVAHFRTVDAFFAALRSAKKKAALYIVDLIMSGGSTLSSDETDHGHLTGLRVAEAVRELGLLSPVIIFTQLHFGVRMTQLRRAVQDMKNVHILRKNDFSPRELPRIVDAVIQKQASQHSHQGDLGDFFDRLLAEQDSTAVTPAIEELSNRMDRTPAASENETGEERARPIDLSEPDQAPSPACAVILTALQVETRAVLRHLRNLTEVVVSGTVFFRGTFDTWIVAVAEVGAGNASAAIITERAIQRFRPRIALFVGVAGGVKDVKIGDVVVATKVYGYESGKETAAGFRPRPDVQNSAHSLEQRGRAIRLQDGWRKRLDPLLSHGLPAIFVAPIAAGEKVIASEREATAKLLRENYGDAVAVEMEGRGFLSGVHINLKVEGCVIRGISDLLDGKGEADKEGSQVLAADAASAVAMELLFSLRVLDVSKEKPVEPMARELATDSSSSSEQVTQTHIILLVHGIRDFARWQNEIRAPLEASGLKVEPTNYGRLGLFQFLTPIPFFRNWAAAEILNQITIVANGNPSASISVIAHSFGTLVISRILKNNFNVRFNRVIFCGSIAPHNFRFEQFSHRFTEPILNEVGTHDPWPAVAESITWGFGNAGTFGFRRPLVRDRWHNKARHGYFLTADFCSRYWIPFLRNGEIVPGDAPALPPPFWVQLIAVLKPKYLILALVCLLLLFVLDYGPRYVHVVGARYGDINNILNVYRSCDVGSKVRASCEGKVACIPWPENKAMCVPEPAPYSNAGDKAVVVRYDCRGWFDDWRALATSVPNFDEAAPGPALRMGDTLWCGIGSTNTR